MFMRRVSDGQEAARVSVTRAAWSGSLGYAMTKLLRFAWVVAWTARLRRVGEVGTPVSPASDGGGFMLGKQIGAMLELGLWEYEGGGERLDRV